MPQYHEIGAPAGRGRHGRPGALVGGDEPLLGSQRMAPEYRPMMEPRVRGGWAFLESARSRRVFAPVHDAQLPPGPERAKGERILGVGLLDP